MAVLPEFDQISTAPRVLRALEAQVAHIVVSDKRPSRHDVQIPAGQRGLADAANK
jgi:hypothetical protein